MAAPAAQGRAGATVTGEPISELDFLRRAKDNSPLPGAGGEDKRRNGRFEKMKRTLFPGIGAFVALLALSLAVGLAGCGSSSDNGPEGSAFVGSWALYDGSAVQGTPAWYVHFRADGTFNITMNANGTGQKVLGTWTESDGQLVGPFTNPNVGEGRVEATITNGVMHLDFIEYWHTPHKVLPFTGTKI